MKKSTNIKLKPKVTIAICAYNEEANIANLVTDILSQKREGFTLKMIWIVSDGSTDTTVEKTSKFKSKLLKIDAYRKRKGKIVRLNEILSSFNSDILVQLDADVRLADRQVLTNLVKPIVNNPEIAMSCGISVAIRPTVFMERIAYFGYKVWGRAKMLLGKNSSARYWCGGNIRAFSKKFVKIFRLPEGETDCSEDVYSYYFAKTRGFEVVIADKAKVFFRMPGSLFDHFKRTARFVKSPANMTKYFDPKVVKRYEKITNKVRFKALMIESKNQSLIAITYVSLQVLIRIYSTFKKQRSMWDIATTTKKRINMK